MHMPLIRDLMMGIITTMAMRITGIRMDFKIKKRQLWARSLIPLNLKSTAHTASKKSRSILSTITLKQSSFSEASVASFNLQDDSRWREFNAKSLLRILATKLISFIWSCTAQFRYKLQSYKLLNFLKSYILILNWIQSKRHRSCIESLWILAL